MSSAPTPLADARRAAGTTKRARAHSAIDQLVDTGRPVTSAAIARAAGVSRTLCYTDPELRAAIINHRTGVPPIRAAFSPVSDVGVRTDLAHARQQLQQLDRDNQLLRHRLARSLGSDLDQRWLQPHASVLDDLEQRTVQLAAENTALQQRVEHLQARAVELEESLTAARAMNRELMTQINTSSAHRS